MSCKIFDFEAGRRAVLAARIERIRELNRRRKFGASGAVRRALFGEEEKADG